MNKQFFLCLADAFRRIKEQAENGSIPRIGYGICMNLRCFSAFRKEEEQEHLLSRAEIWMKGQFIDAGMHPIYPVESKVTGVTRSSILSSYYTQQRNKWKPGTAYRAVRMELLDMLIAAADCEAASYD